VHPNLGEELPRQSDNWRVSAICFLLDRRYSRNYGLLSRCIPAALKGGLKRLLSWDDFVDEPTDPGLGADFREPGADPVAQAITASPPRADRADSGHQGQVDPELAAGRNLLFIVPSLQVGGVQSLVASIADALQRRDDVEVTIASTDPRSFSWHDRFTSDAPNIYDLPPNLAGASAVAYVMDIISRHRIDTVISAVSHEGLAVLRQCKRHLPAVRTLHWLHNDFERCPFLNGSIEWSEAIDLHVVVAEHMRQQLLVSGRVGPERIAVVPSGVDLHHMFNPDRFDRKPCRAAFGLSDDRMAIGFIGRISAEKGPLNFVSLAAALAHRDDVQFVLAGDGSLMDLVKTRAEQLGVADRIICTGELSSDDVVRLLRALDLLTVPSNQDAGPLIVLEAMAMQVPVVAYDVGNVGTMMADGETGFVVARGDRAGFVARVEQVLDDEKLRVRMSKSARSRVLQSPYLLDAMIERYESVLGLDNDKSAGTATADGLGNPIEYEIDGDPTNSQKVRSNE
jgi:glycosyltransferase involved in cell wall biosynthesis